MVVCPGCGFVSPNLDLPPDDCANASGECRRLCNELSAYTWSLGDWSPGDPPFLQQHIVDAYGTSHAGGPSKPIGVFFCLAGIYLAVEEGYTGRQVQKAHMAMAQKSKDWPLFTPPSRVGAVTVADVLAVTPGEKRDKAIMAWCGSVWGRWAEEHKRIRTLVRPYLNSTA